MLYKQLNITLSKGRTYSCITLTRFAKQLDINSVINYSFDANKSFYNIY